MPALFSKKPTATANRGMVMQLFKKKNNLIDKNFIKDNTRCRCCLQLMRQGSYSYISNQIYFGVL
jgi:hypothetical protein